MKTETIEDKMKAAYESLMNRVLAGETLSNKDQRFVDGYASLQRALAGGKGAGNAGKRKTIKTGK